MLPCAVEPLKSSKRLVSTLESMGTVYESDADLIMRRPDGLIQALHRPLPAAPGEPNIYVAAMFFYCSGDVSKYGIGILLHLWHHDVWVGILTTEDIYILYYTIRQTA